MKKAIKKILDRNRDFIDYIIINKHGILGRKFAKILDIKALYKIFKDKKSKDFFLNFTKDKDYIENYSFNLLKEIVNYAYNFVPFYKSFYDSQGFHPNELKTIEDINKIPILKKELFKRKVNSGEIFSTEKRKWNFVCGYTTGSTGTPTKVCHDENILKFKSIGLFRAFFINGIMPSDPFALIWRNKGIDRREIISFLFGNFIYIPVVDVMNIKDTTLNKEKIFNILHILDKFQPKVIRGYVSALYLLAKYYAKYKNKFNINPEIIIGSAEYLPPSVWDELEDIFKCKVLNLYGGTEASPIAISTRHSRDLIVFEDLYHIDLVDFNNNPVKSGMGKIIVTDLYNKYMPLIRYEIGDIAEWGENTIYGYRTFKEVKGRKNDIFILPNGRIVFPDVWYIFFREYEWIKTFRVIQEDINKIKVILYVERKDVCIDVEIEKLKKIIQKSIGENIMLTVSCSDELILDKGQKFRQVFSCLNPTELLKI